MEQETRGYQNLILAEVIRLEWNPKYRTTGLKRPMKAEIKAYGNVTHKLLTLIDEVSAHVPEKLYKKHAAEWFRDLFRETESIGHVYSEEIPGAQKLSGKDALTKLMGSQNKQLTTLSSNPFRAPFTKEFFDVALDLATTDDRFVEPLRDYTNARSDLLGQAKKNQKEQHGFVFYRGDSSGKFQRVRQGRKKNYF